VGDHTPATRRGWKAPEYNPPGWSDTALSDTPAGPRANSFHSSGPLRPPPPHHGHAGRNQSPSNPAPSAVPPRLRSHKSGGPQRDPRFRGGRSPGQPPAGGRSAPRTRRGPVANRPLVHSFREGPPPRSRGTGPTRAESEQPGGGRRGYSAPSAPPTSPCLRPGRGHPPAGRGDPGATATDLSAPPPREEQS